MKNRSNGLSVRLFGIATLVAAMGLILAGCDTGGGGNGDIDTAALDAAILEANEAREGIETASVATEVPEGKFWVTEDEWTAFDTVFRAAVETQANPSSQPAVNTARSNLRAAIDALNAAKKEGSGAAIKLSGTITVKNNGQLVPYVLLQAHMENWDDWSETLRIHLTEDNTPWEIITRPFEDSAGIAYQIIGYDNAQYENHLFITTVEGLRTQVHNADVSNISINLDYDFITISGTFNLDYGRPIPSVTIQAIKTDDSSNSIGVTNILNAGNNNSWSMMIPSQDANTPIVFSIVGFDGPVTWEYDMLFAFWNKDFGVTVGNQNKSGIAFNFITVSGTVDVSCNGGPVPLVEITLWKVNEDDNWDWLTWTELYNPSANAPWSIVLPAYTSDTEILVQVTGKDENGNRLFWDNAARETVKDTNISGIAIAINSSTISVSGTVNVTDNGNPVHIVSITISEKAGEDRWNWLGGTELYSPPANSPWTIVMPAFTSDTEVRIEVQTYDENDEYFGRTVETITVKDTDVSGIALNFISLSGTVNLTYNGNPVPSVYIQIDKTVGEGAWEYLIGRWFYNLSANSPWSMVIPAFTSDTEVRISVEGYDENGGYLFGRTVETRTAKDANVSGIAINSISLSGTVNVTYNGNPVPRVYISIHKETGENVSEWLGSANLISPSANSPWSISIPAFTSDTEVRITVWGYDENDASLFMKDLEETTTVKDANVPNIALNLGEMAD